MVTPELLSYVRTQLSQKVPQEKIRENLATIGWSQDDISQALIETSSFAIASPPTTVSSTSLPGVIDLLKAAWQIYKERLWTFVGIEVVPVISQVLVVSLMAMFTGFLTTRGIIGTGIFSYSPILFIVFIPLLLLNIVLLLWSHVALLYAIKDSQEGVGVIESYKRAKPKIFSYLWVTLLMFCIAAGAFILLIIPGIIVSLWIFCAVYIVVTEDEKGMNAILKSREYVRGYWGSVLWRFIGLVLLIIIAAIPVLFVSAIFPPLQLIFWFISPIFTVYFYLLYQYLKQMKRSVLISAGKTKTFFTITGILGAIIFPGFIILSIIFAAINPTGQLTKGRDAARLSSMKTTKVALSRYYNDHQTFPQTLSQLVPTYLSTLPKDPSTHTQLQYQRRTNGQDFLLCTQFETKSYPSCIDSQTNFPPAVPQPALPQSGSNGTVNSQNLTR